VSQPLLTVSPPLPLDAWLRKVAGGPLPFPLADTTRLYARARAGLCQALWLVGLGEGDVALLPAYHHGSEVEAYVRAGLTPRFYDTGEGLVPETGELAALLTPDVRVVHLIHYLGLAQPVDEWRAFADEHGLLLVEDVAQGWLGSAQDRPLGSVGDVALFSVYKSVGVPDGGVAAVRGEAVAPAGRPPLRLAALARKHASLLSSRSGLLGALHVRRRASRAYDPAQDFDLGHPDRATSRATLALVRRLAPGEVAQRRRRHYRRLLAELGRWVPQPYRRDPAEASPFAFPVFCEDKGRVINALRAAGIGAVDAWSVAHPSLPLEDHPGAARWRAGIVLLPVHQELRGRDVERIAREARAVLEGDGAAPR
jgi:dTDP-4-amino-4,6-dideoxygalactose transaminase